MGQLNFTLSVLYIREGCDDGQDVWVAQCLEYDIAAQGKTIDEAQRSFEKTFVGQVVVDLTHEQRPLEGIERAPKYYWDKFDAAKRLADRHPIRFPKSVPAGVVANAEDMRVFA